MDRQIWTPENEQSSTNESSSHHIGVFVPVDVVFPGSEATVAELRRTLAPVSRTDALIWCARINLVVSNATYFDSFGKQRFGVQTIFSAPEIRRISDFFGERAGLGKASYTFVFFRAQLLELMRWVALTCSDSPDDGCSFEKPDVRSAFGKAALIASDFWAQSVFPNKLIPNAPRTKETRVSALGAFRQGTDAVATNIDPLMAIGRGRSLFIEHLAPSRPNFLDEFEGATGLSLGDFYGLVTIIATHNLQRVDELESTRPGAALFHENHYVAFRELERVFPCYAGSFAQSPDDMVLSAKHSESSKSPFSAWKRSVRERPILRTSDGRCVVIDPAIFAEHVAVGPLFAVLKSLKQEQSNELFADFGTAFERYALSILRRMYPVARPPLVDRLVCNPEGFDSHNRAVEISDACLNDGTEIALFEMKAVWLPDQLAENPDPNIYRSELERRYAAFQDPLKGIGQLARSIANLASGEWQSAHFDRSIMRILYPVIITYDNLLDAAGHPWFLADQFEEALAPDSVLPTLEMVKAGIKVSRPIVISIDDLERLETSVEHFSLMQLLKDYSAAFRERNCGLHNYLVNSPYGNKLFASRSVAESTLSALETARGLMAP